MIQFLVKRVLQAVFVVVFEKEIVRRRGDRLPRPAGGAVAAPKSVKNGQAGLFGEPVGDFGPRERHITDNAPRYE